MRQSGNPGLLRKTFPHHLHEEEGVKESEEITFAEVLGEIEERHGSWHTEPFKEDHG